MQDRSHHVHIYAATSDIVLMEMRNMLCRTEFQTHASSHSEASMITITLPKLPDVFTLYIYIYLSVLRPFRDISMHPITYILQPLFTVFSIKQVLIHNLSKPTSEVPFTVH